MSSNSLFQLDSFRQATPYIYAHRGRTFVLYINDSLLAKDNVAALIHDFALVHTLGVKLVLVLGLRSFIDKKLSKKKPAVNFMVTGALLTFKPSNRLKKLPVVCEPM